MKAPFKNASQEVIRQIVIVDGNAVKVISDVVIGSWSHCPVAQVAEVASIITSHTMSQWILTL